MANTIRIQLRSDTRANWESVNPVLLRGELGLDLTENRIKIGDGTHKWAELEYACIRVIDNLTSSSSAEALSANQGVVLKGLIPAVTDNLTSSSKTNALSASQGKRLDSKKLEKSAVNSESWTFKLKDGSTAVKKVTLWSS